MSLAVAEPASAPRPPCGRHLHAGTDQLEWLQSLRGIAALMVLFFHMAPHWELVPQLQPFVQLTRLGFSGVDIFFVISGFVVYQSGRRSIPKFGLFYFLKKRFARIWLTYWPTFIAVSVISIYFLNIYPKSTEQLVLSFFLLYPKVWDNWVGVAWSLTYELYFYFVLGWLLMLPKKSQTPGIFILTAFLILWNIGWLCLSPEEVLKESQPLPFLLGGFIIEFLVGGLISIAYNARKELFFLKHWHAPTIGSIVLIGFFIGSQSIYFDRVEIMRAGSYGLAALGCLVMALMMEQTKYRPYRIFVKIGNFSFSLYLVHDVILRILETIRSQLLFDQKQLWLGYSLLMPFVILMVSYTWYLAVEARTIRWVKRI